MAIVWIIVFIISLAVLVKSAGWLLSGAERIGLAIGLSPFIVGVTIVGLGTSLPELISSFIAVFEGVPEIVVANAVGSNIANILLVVGLSTVIGRRLVVTKNLIDLDLPLLAIGTTLMIGVAWDREVTFLESVILLITYGVYFAYTILHRDDVKTEEDTELAVFIKKNSAYISKVSKKIAEIPRIALRDFGLLAAGAIGLFLGAKYLVESVINLSDMLNIGAGVIAITAIAIGTSLPELIVSVRAAVQRKSEIALGNIFGSNLFNMLVVIGLPGLFTTLPLDEKTFSIGLPVMAAATLLFVVSGISRRIHMWEGAFYLILYVFFIGKLFNLL
jgi:cation:H+ antiporter